MQKSFQCVRSAAIAALALGIGATSAAAGGFERYEAAGSIKDAAPAASDSREFSWSVNGGLMSDYVFRGISQSGEDPSWFVGADASYGIFYAGVWAAKVDRDFVGADAEVDLYAGIKPVLGPATFDFGVIYYGYVGQDDAVTGGLDVDFWEFKAGVSGDILPKLTAGVAYYYSPETTLEGGETHTVEGNLAYALPKVWVFDPSVSGTLGYSEFDETNFDYTYWNAGLSLTVEKLTLDFRYWDTDTEVIFNGNDLADERFVFKATVALP
jgi:uncharacterized protein (TIGR02001 family)